MLPPTEATPRLESDSRAEDRNLTDLHPAMQPPGSHISGCGMCQPGLSINQECDLQPVFISRSERAVPATLGMSMRRKGAPFKVK